MTRSITLFLLLLLSCGGAYSQITYPIDLHDGQMIPACSGAFVDSGGDTITQYGSEEDFSVTFYSSDENKPYFSMKFDFFDLGPGDYLYVYDGENNDAPLLFEATENELTGEVLWPSSDTLHFRFTSSPSDHGYGWWAEIACYSLCELFTVDVTTNFETMKLCPGTGATTLIAEGYYMSDNIDFDPAQLQYEWFYDGQTHTGPTLDYIFDDPGANPFRINVYDPVNDCEKEVYETVQVGTIPNFAGTKPGLDTVCAEEIFTLGGVVNTTTWTGFPTSVHDTVPIPDGTTESYTSSLNFDVFEDDAILESGDDFGRICLIIDHVDYRQLRFELQCPDGSDVIIKDYDSEEDSPANLGEPVAVDHIDAPGVGYEYCFTLSEIAEYGLMSETTPESHEYYDQFGNFYPATYLPEGSYTFYESPDNLGGCPLNGAWTLTVTDNTPGENGYMSGWSLLFNNDIYPDSLIFTPEIVSQTWYDNGNPLEGNPALASKDEEGEYEFKFEVTDNFNCTYDTIVTVNILPIPNAEIISELELPFCEGDSTLLTVHPVNDDDYNWIYQWEINDIIQPNRTHDTIMAKETGMYTVAITDTIIGCTAYIEKEITEQNCELEIPNVFTPNFDGINDYFEIINLEHYDRAHIIIYNRWGKKVFEHSDYYDNWWDGNGAPDGVYYYVLTYERLGVERSMHGVVHIIR